MTPDEKLLSESLRASPIARPAAPRSRQEVRVGTPSAEIAVRITNASRPVYTRLPKNRLRFRRVYLLHGDTEPHRESARDDPADDENGERREHAAAPRHDERADLVRSNQSPAVFSGRSCVNCRRINQRSTSKPSAGTAAGNVCHAACMDLSLRYIDPMTRAPFWLLAACITGWRYARPAATTATGRSRSIRTFCSVTLRPSVRTSPLPPAKCCPPRCCRMSLEWQSARRAWRTKLELATWGSRPLPGGVS